MRLFRAAAAAGRALRAFIPRLLTLARQLFNEVMGMFFLSLAVFFTIGAHGLITTFNRLDEHPDEFLQFLGVLAFVLMWVGFAVTSFLRARKLGRSHDVEP